MIGKPDKLINYLLTLDRDNLYEVKEKNETRSNKQNRYMWELITLCVEKQTGRKNKDDVDALYVSMLMYTMAKTDYSSMLATAYERFRNAVMEGKSGIRGVAISNKYIENGKEYVSYIIVYGSSQFDKKEMGLLIDNLLDYASNLEIETEYWKELLK